MYYAKQRNDVLEDSLNEENTVHNITPNMIFFCPIPDPPPPARKCKTCKAHLEAIDIIIWIQLRRHFWDQLRCMEVIHFEYTYMWIIGVCSTGKNAGVVPQKNKRSTSMSALCINCWYTLCAVTGNALDLSSLASHVPASFDGCYKLQFTHKYRLNNDAIKSIMSHAICTGWVGRWIF